MANSWRGWLLASAAMAVSGCQFVPRSDLAASQARERALTEQNHAQLSELATLKRHSRELEDRIIQFEQETAQRSTSSPKSDKFY